MITRAFRPVNERKNTVLLTGSSAIVNDIYRNIVLRRRGVDINSDAVRRTTVSYTRRIMFLMTAVGLVLVLVRTPQFLSLVQYVAFSIIGSASAGLIAGTVLWRRATAAGVLASMVAGFGSYVVAASILKDPGAFVSGVIGGVASLVVLVLVSLVTAPPSRESVVQAFGK